MSRREDIAELLSRFPKTRPPLPASYKELWEREYEINRGTHGGVLYRLIAALESWCHRKVASIRRPGPVLEIGCGILNHLAYERYADAYDVIEPNRFFYEGQPGLAAVRTIYADIDEIPGGNADFEPYGRILSVAVLEHIEALPAVIAKAGLLLAEDGEFQTVVPTEGGMLWGLGWRCTTAIAFKLRTGLNYKPFLAHEHVNTAPEVLALIGHFFETVTVRRFPTPFFHLSFYTYIGARGVQRDRCRAYLGKLEAETP